MELELKAFLEATGVVNWDNPKIKFKAGELTLGCKDDAEKARWIFEWVRDEIKHSHDHAMNPITCSASEALEYGTGYCFAKSHLLVALLRAAGIPGGFCYQRKKDKEGNYYLHGYCAAYLPGFGWYRVDARGNKPGVNAQFTPPVEKLAYVINQEGEWDDPRVRPEPLREVLQALRTYPTWDQLLENIPDLPAIPPL
jgi:transglutaminase-like putative cysteine protease